MNYRSDANGNKSFVTLQNILEDYQDNSSEKENCDLNVVELGKIIAEVFPNLKKFQKRINGTRTWVYSIAKIQILDKSTDDSIRWQNLPDFITTEFGWLLTNQTFDDQFEWVKINPHDLSNGQRIIYELSIFKNWTFTVKTLGISTLSSSKRIIRSIFHVLNASLECKGFSVPTNNIVKDIKGNTVGTTEEWCNKLDGAVVTNLRSLTCRVLIPKNYSRSSSRLCDECVRIKRNCKIACNDNAKPALKMRESYMSKEELKHKLHEEKVRRVNTE